MTLMSAYGDGTTQTLTRTSYGDVRAERLVPVVQFTAIYGLQDKVESLAFGGASIVTGVSVFEILSGTGPFGTAAILSKRAVQYRAGQGILGRWTAIFDTPQPDSEQDAGLSTAIDQLSFGFNGTEFGIKYNRNGENEIQELTISSGAGGSENATITVDGDPFTVPLTAGTAAHNALEIAASLQTQLGGLYNFTANGDEVVARSLFATPQGSFAFSSSTAAATWAQIQGGIVSTKTFIAQADWNLNTRLDLDPLKGNTYQVQFQYLGFGAIIFAIESAITGEIEPVHLIRYANNFVVPNMSNPALRVGWSVENLGNTTSISVKGSSAAIFHEGELVITEPPRSLIAAAPGVGTGDFENILTIRNRLVLGTKRNRVEAQLLNILGIVDNTKGAILEVLADVPVFADDIFFQYVDKTNSVIEYSTTQVDVTNGRLVASIPINELGSAIDLEKLGIVLFPGETLTFAVKVISGSASDVQVTLNWVEDL